MTTFKKFPQRFTGVALAVSLLALPALATGATYYVNAASGTDAGNCSSACKTITYAAAQATSGISGAPDIIMVATGTYDILGNGETFPINFTNDYVSLTNDGSGLTTIDALGGFDALDVDAKGFSVSGFTFSNAIDAIEISEGGFTIANNIFDATVADGIYFYKSDTDLSTSVSFPDMAITGNTFNTTANGVDVDITQDFDYTTENLTASFGNFTVSGNTFAVTSNDGLDASDLFEIDDLYNGTVTVGDFTVTNNTFTGGTTGFDFASSIDDIEDCQVTVGNIVVSNNTCTDHSNRCIDLDYWDPDGFYGATTAVFGDITVHDNTAEATDYATYPGADGIYISDLEYITDIYDETTVTTGTLNVTNNTIDVDDNGIYIYSDGIYDIGEQYWGDTVSVTTGPRNISNNTINSNDTSHYGMYIELAYIGEDMYGFSSVTYGDINVTNNTVTAGGEALYYELYESGYDIYEDTTCTIGTTTFSGNTLTSTNDYGFYYESYENGSGMEQNGMATFGPTYITNNTITSNSSEAAYYYFYYTGYDNYNNSSFVMNPYTIDNNTINAAGSGGDGIFVDFGDYNGVDLYDNAQVTLPDWIITNNTIDATGDYNGLTFELNYTGDLEDNAFVHVGSVLIDSNTFNPNKDAGMYEGVEVGIYESNYDAYGPSVTTYDDITITNNIFYNMSDTGVYVWYEEVGYDFTGAPSQTMGDINIGMNTVDMSVWGIYLDLDLYTEDGAMVTVGDLNIYDNTLTGITDTGIYVYYYNENNDPDDATLTIGDTTVSGNTVTGDSGTDNGIYFYVDNSTEGITFGMPTINNNTISDFNNGVYVELYEQDDLTMSCNWIQNNAAHGILFDTEATGVTVMKNSITGNTTSGLTVNDGFTAVVNAESNWWGDKLGPAACASCNGVNPGDMGTVDYMPFLTYEPQKSRCGVAFPWVMFAPATTGMGPAVP